MSSSDDDDGDLFADSDSDDTAELLEAAAAAGPSKKPAGRLKKKTTAAAAAPPARKKAQPKKKKVVAAEESDDDSSSSSSSDDDNDDDDKGLFDSDSDDSDEDDSNKKMKLKKKKAAAEPKKVLSKRERLEALAKKNRRTPDSKPEAAENKPKEGRGTTDREEGGGGYDSGDSYDSADFERTQADDDFLDTTGEDQDAVQELYAEQHFDDERPDKDKPKKKKKRKIRYDDGGGGEDSIDTATGSTEPDNPIMAAVHRMKKKKREKKSFTELEEEAKALLGKMEWAAEQDEMAIAEKKPALNKLSMLSEVVDALTKKDLQRMLLDLDLLVVCKRWIQPLRNGQLGNVTVRQRLLEALAGMSGEGSITPGDLKQSGFGKVVMLLYKHKSETPAMKQQHKRLVEAWSRPIFQKSGNMRDLQHVQRGTEYGLAALSRQQQELQQQQQQSSAGGGTASGASPARHSQDLRTMIAGKKVDSGSSGSTGPRVRVPFSKGFAYSVRPAGKAGGIDPEDVGKKGGGGAAPTDNRSKLSKRMLEKGRKASKNQRSANISIEGRKTKG